MSLKKHVKQATEAVKRQVAPKTKPKIGVFLGIAAAALGLLLFLEK